MSVIESRVNARNAEFEENHDAMTALVEDLRAKVVEISRGGDEQSRDKHLKRGKMLVTVSM